MMHVKNSQFQRSVVIFFSYGDKKFAHAETLRLEVSTDRFFQARARPGPKKKLKFRSKPDADRKRN